MPAEKVEEYIFMKLVSEAKTPAKMQEVLKALLDPKTAQQIIANEMPNMAEPAIDLKQTPVRKAIVEKPAPVKEMALIKKYLNETEDYAFKLLLAEENSNEKYERVSTEANKSNRRADELVEKTGNFEEAAEFCIEKANKRFAPKLKKGWKISDEDGLAAHMKEFWMEKASYYCSKAGEKYEKEGKFKEAGEMYYAAAYDAIYVDQKRMFYEKSGENYEESGNFKEAGEMYYKAFEIASDPVQRQTLRSKTEQNYSKVAENCEKSGNFREAGKIYMETGIFASDPLQRQAFYSKAEQNCAKAEQEYETTGNFKEASLMYEDMTIFYSQEAREMSRDLSIGDPKLPVEKKSEYESKAKKYSVFAAALEATPNERDFLIFLSSKFRDPSTKDVLGKLPNRYMPIFIEEAIGKKDVFSKLNEKQLPEAFNRIESRIENESKEFGRQISSGGEIDAKYAKYLYCVVSNVELSDFVESVSAVAKKLGLENRTITPAFFEELYTTANEKLKPPFAFPTEVYSLDFLARQVDASVPADAIKSAATAIKDAVEAHERQKTETTEPKDRLKERCGEVLKISEIQDDAQRKEKVLELMPEDKRKAYQDGKMTDENAIRLILKNKDIGDLSWVFWDIASKLPEADQMLLKKVSQNKSLDQTETNSLVQLVSKLDVYLGEYLLDNKLSALEPSIKATPAFREFANIKKKVTEVAAKQASENMDLKLVFGQKNRLLDIFAGSFSGNCLGDDPAFSLARKDVEIATIYKDNQPMGSAFFLMREINGKKSLVLFGVDFSESLTGSADAGTMLSTEKVNELTKWVAQCTQEYATKSGFMLYATEKGGGISNNSTAKSELRRHLGKVEVQFEKSGKLHEDYGYNMSTAYEFGLRPPGK